jgi:hypothetical protein
LSGVIFRMAARAKQSDALDVGCVVGEVCGQSRRQAIWQAGRKRGYAFSRERRSDGLRRLSCTSRIADRKKEFVDVI